MSEPLSPQPGYADVLVGLQYGDEGKAKIVDYLARDYDVIARFNGGANAGHSVENDQGQRVGLNQIPSGIFYPEKTLYIGSGCVVNIAKLIREIRSVVDLGVDLEDRLRISPYAAVVQPHHILLDSEMGKSIGTTRNGIGPAYADRAYRAEGDRLLSLRMGDVLDDAQAAEEAMEGNLRHTAECLRVRPDAVAAVMEDMRTTMREVAPFIESDTRFLQKQVQRGRTVLFEGAQSFMLDVAKGIVPYVTSSHCEAGSAFVGGDLPPNLHRRTIGVAKAVMTRVGNGPFVSEIGGQRSEEYSMAEGGAKYVKTVESELYDPEELIRSDDPFYVGIGLRMLGNEYGVVTKRPRRVGMLDLVQLRYAVQANGVDELYLTKCDTLREFARTRIGKIPLVMGYRVDGREIDYVPATDRANRRIEPVIDYREGFAEDISAASAMRDLPAPLQGLLREIEEFATAPLAGIGTGPQRNQLVVRGA